MGEQFSHTSMEQVIAQYGNRQLIETNHPHPKPWIYITTGMVRGGIDMIITGRDNEPGKTPQILPGLQYIEVGAGLGGFTPDVVRYTQAAPNFKPPIVIDPVSYHELGKLLTSGRKRATDEGKKRIDTFLERCEVMLDPTKVRHYRTTLTRAVARHPELHGAGDVVLDRLGGAFYTNAHHRAESDLYALSKGTVHILWS